MKCCSWMASRSPLAFDTHVPSDSASSTVIAPVQDQKERPPQPPKTLVQFPLMPSLISRQRWQAARGWWRQQCGAHQGGDGVAEFCLVEVCVAIVNAQIIKDRGSTWYELPRVSSTWYLQRPRGAPNLADGWSPGVGSILGEADRQRAVTAEAARLLGPSPWACSCCLRCLPQ